MADWRAPGPRGWKSELDPTGTEVHIRPRGDLIYHSFEDCPCGPTTSHIDLDETPVAWFVVHHPLDDRGAPPEGHYIASAAGPCPPRDDDGPDCATAA